MSLVGPRPCIPYETALFGPHHFERFLVPGGHHGPLAGDRAVPGDVRGGARPGRRVRPRLVARARPAPAGPDAAPGLPRPGHGMTPVRFAVVGLGYWGPQLVRNLFESPDAELVTVCDARPEALAQIGRRYPRSRGRRPSTRRSSPTRRSRRSSSRRRSARTIALARAALEAGKHAFVEKPLAARWRRRRSSSALARELGLVLMPGHTFLYSPPVQAIRDLIASGELGEIYFVSTSRVNLGLHQSDASVVWDLGPHDFSILSYWLEESPVARDRTQPRLRHAGHARRRVHPARVRLGSDRQRRARLARAEQAAPDDRGRVAEDGRLRRHVGRAGARLRLAA